MPKGVYIRRFNRMKRHAVIQPLDQSYRLIPLTQGQNAIVDAEDFEWLMQWNWHAYWCPTSKTFYAGRNEKKARGYKPMPMHRQILNSAKGEEVDHRNFNGLDNRRENIRRCNRNGNAHNKRVCSVNTSGYKGVSLYKPLGKWVSVIRSNGKRMHLGYFETAEMAAKAYDTAAIKYHGEFAHLNLPAGEPSDRKRHQR